MPETLPQHYTAWILGFGCLMAVNTNLWWRLNEDQTIQHGGNATGLTELSTKAFLPRGIVIEVKSE